MSCFQVLERDISMGPRPIRMGSLPNRRLALLELFKTQGNCEQKETSAAAGVTRAAIPSRWRPKIKDIQLGALPSM